MPVRRREYSSVTGDPQAAGNESASEGRLQIAPSSPRLGVSAVKKEFDDDDEDEDEGEGEGEEDDEAHRV